MLYSIQNEKIIFLFPIGYFKNLHQKSLNKAKTTSKNNSFLKRKKLCMEVCGGSGNDRNYRVSSLMVFNKGPTIGQIIIYLFIYT